MKEGVIAETRHRIRGGYLGGTGRYGVGKNGDNRFCCSFVVEMITHSSSSSISALE